MYYLLIIPDHAVNSDYKCGHPHEKGPYGRYGVTYRAIYQDEVPTFQAQVKH